MFTKIPGGRELQAYKPFNLGALLAEADTGVVGTWLTVAVITLHPGLIFCLTLAKGFIIFSYLGFRINLEGRFYLQSYFIEEETGRLNSWADRGSCRLGLCQMGLASGTWPLLPLVLGVPVFTSSFWCLFESVTTGLAHGMPLRRRCSCWREFKAMLTGMILRLT